MTRDGFEVGQTDFPAGVYKVDARSRVVYNSESARVATTKSHYISLQKAAIVADLSPYMHAHVPQCVSVLFRRDTDYNTYQHPFNYSLMMLDRMMRVEVGRVVKTHHDIVALVLGQVKEGTMISYHELGVAVRRYCVTHKSWTQAYKINNYALVVLKIPERYYKLALKDTPYAFNLRVTRHVLNTILTKLLVSARKKTQ